MAGALDGIKILDFTHYYAGPFCTLLLKDLGAEIIKVERTLEGDPTRNGIPQTEGLEGGGFIILNRGKKSVTLNLREERGRAICKDLVKQVDVVVENFSPGVMDKLGLGSQELSKLNPKLIYASISAFGQTGPRRTQVAYDPVGQAMGGLMSVTGFPDNPPTKVGAPIADLSSGIFTALAIMGALIHRLRTGEGQTIDISMQDCVWLLTATYHGPQYFLDGQIPQRTGNSESNLTPFGVYPAKDGSVLIVAVALGQVEKLLRIMGRPDLVDSPLCSLQSERIKHRDEFDALISSWTKDRTVEDILSPLKAADVPCCPVPTFDQVANDPQIVSRNMVVEVEQLVSGRVKAPGSVFKLSKTPGDVTSPAPILGEHNVEVYSNLLGYAAHEIDQLVEAGII